MDIILFSLESTGIHNIPLKNECKSTTTKRILEFCSPTYSQSLADIIPALDQTSVQTSPQNTLPPFYNIEKEYLFDLPIYPFSTTIKDRFEIAEAKLFYYDVPVKQFADTNRVLNVSEAGQFSHEVKFDRGRKLDQESFNRADCLLRIDTFIKSRYYTRGLAEGLSLALWGFFHIDDPANSDRIKCSFCRKEFLQGIHVAFSPFEFDEEILLIRFKNKHAQKSSICPMSFGLKGDNNDVTRERLNQYFQLQRGIFQQVSRMLAASKIPHLETIELKYLFASVTKEEVLEVGEVADPFQKISQPETGVDKRPVENLGESLNIDKRFNLLAMNVEPSLDDNYFYQICAEFEEEPYSEFNLLEEILEGYYLYRRPFSFLDSMVKIKPPKHSRFATLDSRLKTFDHPAWNIRINNQPTMEDFTNAGFFYEGEDDAVKCFWCDLGLKRFSPNDQPWKEHGKYSPRCPFVIRCKGRQFIKQILIDCVALLPSTLTPYYNPNFSSKLASIKKETHEIRGIFSNHSITISVIN